MTNVYEQTVYRQYRVFVDNEDAQHTKSDWLTIQTAQKYVYLHIYPEEIKFRNYDCSTVRHRPTAV